MTLEQHYNCETPQRQKSRLTSLKNSIIEPKMPKKASADKLCCASYIQRFKTETTSEMRRTFLELRDLEYSVEEEPDAEILQKLRDAIELEDIE